MIEPVSGELPVSAMVKAAQRVEHELRCYDDALALIASYRDDNSRRHALAAAYPKADQSPALRTLLKTKLYPYQLEGAWFLANTGRALLGDDMGLGKTVQALAATARC